MPDVIHNWDRLVLKGVRSDEGEDIGNIIAIDKDSFFDDRRAFPLSKY
jgi:hypothetical protein